jgi:hypothetical protein
MEYLVVWFATLNSFLLISVTAGPLGNLVILPEFDNMAIGK